jgi:hypothetical protein
MAAHYDTAILPARPRRPRDKAKVEAAVLIIESWLLGLLATSPILHPGRAQRCDPRVAVATQREAADPPACGYRQALLKELDRPHLKPLPVEPYDYAEWRLRRVGMITTSRSKHIFTASPTALPAARSRSG